MDVIGILHKIGYTDLRDFGNSYRTRPLYRSSGNSTSLAIKKDTGVWYDFSERIGGHIGQLAKLTLQLPNMEEVNKFLGTELSDVTPMKQETVLSQVKTFDKNTLLQLVQKHDYWTNRGISLETVKLFQGGLFYKGGMVYRYVFPIFNQKDEIVGFAGRSLNDNPDYPKWKLRGKKMEWIYPMKLSLPYIMEKREVILVESIGDMLALWDNNIRNVLVTFGVEVSPKIIEFLLKIDASKIFIALNNDDEGNDFVGNRAAADTKEQLNKFFDDNQVIIKLPIRKDFGEMTKDEIHLWKTEM